jgi:diguanylate cyclase (GGDEF)-like protein/PAS domain S-box-containing protein/putative nucleotidyltransferase with HDIG domain
MGRSTKNNTKDSTTGDTTEEVVQTLQRQLHRRFTTAVILASLIMALLWGASALYFDREARLNYILAEQQALGAKMLSSNSLSGAARKQGFQKLQQDWNRFQQEMNVATLLWPAAKNALDEAREPRTRIEKQLARGAAGNALSDADIKSALTPFNASLKPIYTPPYSPKNAASLLPGALQPFLPLGAGLLTFAGTFYLLLPGLTRPLYKMGEDVRKAHKDEAQKASSLSKTHNTLEENNQQLKLALVRTREIFDRMPFPSFTFNHEGRVLEWNNMAEKTFGFTSMDAIDKPFWELLPNSHFGMSGRETLNQIMDGKTPGATEWSIQREGKKPLFLQNYTLPLHDVENNLQGGVHINFDVTDRRQTNLVLEEQVKQISKFNEDLNQANSRLESLATTDGLTGLKNHRAFQEILDTYFKDAQKHNKTLSVILVDVDNFKKYNDLFGHPEGDDVLKVLSSILRNNVRRGDFVARYGGEEFIVLLPNSNVEEAIVLAERMHQAIGNHIWKKRVVSASFGIATLSNAMQYPSDIIVQADQALYLSKRKGRDRVTHFDAQQIESIGDDKFAMIHDPQIAHLSTEELVKVYDAAVIGWCRLLTLRDEETEAHSERVTDLTMRVAREMKMDDDKLVYVRWGSLLHDIGKIGVPDRILSKPGPLTEEEREIMSHHPSIAYEMLAPISFLRPALTIPFCHHEKWDGTGYPRGLKGEEIPLEARIFALSDVWDALRSDRPYRKRWPKVKVTEHIKSLIGTHFDPDVAEVFLKVVEDPNQR